MWRLANTTLTNKILLKLELGIGITCTRRKGMIFWGTASQKKCLKLRVLTMLINHMWNGAAPSFIIVIRKSMSLNNNPLHKEMISTTELNAWNIKYFTTWEFLKLCWYRRRMIKKLNILISNLNQIKINEFEVRPNRMLNKFIMKAKTVSKGEIKNSLPEQIVHF